jgi:two-component system, LytTR family, sensor histidine kinase AlgZ
MQAITNRSRLFWIHLLFWGVYASFFFYQISTGRRGEEATFEQIFRDFAFHIGGLLVICYFNYAVLLPRFFEHKSFNRYLLEFSITFSVMIYVFILGKQYVVDGFSYQEKWIYTSRFMVSVVINSLILSLFIGMLKFAENWFELEARKKEMENEQLMSELRFLKAQINPHFLFNTLNNLYFLAFTNSPQTPEVIDKLSQMMRYMIYDSNHPKVPLSKEIDYMKNYISLEKLRLNNQVPIDFDIAGNTEGVQIVPLVLITFLENAFKHGVTNNATDAWIKVKLLIEGKTCFYSVENSKLTKQESDNIVKSGIGLQNVQRRLDLSYPKQYELTVKDTEKSYGVRLRLDVA